MSDSPTPTPNDWEPTLVTLTTEVIGSPEAGPELDIVLATVRWMRDHPIEACLLIGDLTKGY